MAGLSVSASCHAVCCARDCCRVVLSVQGHTGVCRGVLPVAEHICYVCLPLLDGTLLGFDVCVCSWTCSAVGGGRWAAPSDGRLAHCGLRSVH
jgi:hypothetical protein